MAPLRPGCTTSPSASLTSRRLPPPSGSPPSPPEPGTATYPQVGPTLALTARNRAAFLRIGDQSDRFCSAVVKLGVRVEIKERRDEDFDDRRYAALWCAGRGATRRRQRLSQRCRRW